MANRRFNQFFYTFHQKPVLLDFSFVVDPTNVNGAGASGLKGRGISSVFMNTSASFNGVLTSGSPNITAISSTSALAIGMSVQGTGIPAGAKIASIISATSVAMTVNASATESSEAITYQAAGNPNPGAGKIIINLQDCYNAFLGAEFEFMSPLSGTSLTATTANAAAVITILGTATLAQWRAVGLPVGITPAIGVAFVPTASATIGGSAAVQVIATGGSGVDHVELLGDPNMTIISNAGSQAVILGQASGAYLIAQAFLSNVQTAPTALTKIYAQLLLSSSTSNASGQAN